MNNNIAYTRALKDKKVYFAKLARFALTSKILTIRQRVRILRVGGTL